ncbi:MAG: hypothetical protein EBR30_03605 [Cytophagia bacterium]|jgi:hypothetical protein|nr:hypothetical protein [Cytophagia bacterium]
MYIKVPTYYAVTDTWSHTEFATREEFVEFLWSMFKEPGQYQFDSTSEKFNEQARVFNKHRVYTTAPNRSKDFVYYWDTQKDRCRNGVIMYGASNTWYLTRDYYMWLNFLPIYNKEVSKFTFADVRDAQYHMALYEDIAKHSYKHCAILKKRQIASSYYHAAKIINLYWFEEGAVNKMAGSLKDYINEKGTWRFLEEYRNFLNTHTGWYRPSNPDKVLNWEQKIEVSQGGKKRDVGLKSVIFGLALEKDPTNGVGGPCTFFFHEEAGIAPRMNETIEYLLPAMKSGMIYTGMFVAAGSVGDLEQCEPLKELVLNPDSKDVLAVETNLVNEAGEIAQCGLFIPEQWSMQPCIDQYGNSQVEKALEMILAERVEWKKKLKPEDYQLRISQKPINIEEAFAYRKVSKFPLALVSRQIRRIEDGEYYREFVELYRDDNNKVSTRDSRKLPISEFPISPKTQDKEGVVVLYERPVKDPEFGTYYASIDPVSEGKTTTSESLCSIYVYKTAQEITKHKMDGSIEQHIERDKIVASWCGRFDDLNKTHERLEMLIEYYNAWTIVENNVSLFIQYMISRRKQRYLVPKNQILFLKELQSNTNVYQEYGWRNVGTIFKTNLISYATQFLEEQLDVETKPDGEIVKTTYGVERIPDIMLLKEMAAYRDGLNVDRLVAFCALAAFAKVQESNRGYSRRVEREDSNLENSKKVSKLRVSPFRHMGNAQSASSIVKAPRNPFKNLG